MMRFSPNGIVQTSFWWKIEGYHPIKKVAEFLVHTSSDNTFFFFLYFYGHM